jgi:hypothetical protein
MILVNFSSWDNAVAREVELTFVAKMIDFDASTETESADFILGYWEED